MKKIRTAVIGLGRIGWWYHIPQITEHEGFELIAVTDRMEERLAEAKEKYGAACYTDHVKMYESERPDLVVVASPTPFHCEHAIQAMEHGIDVFLDKPMAMSLKEADEIIAVKERTGRKLMIYQPHRVTAQQITLESIIATGKIGRVHMIKRAATDYARRNDWQSLIKNGGGMLNNYGAHFIDQLLYLTDFSVRRVFCLMQNIASIGDAEDVVKIVMETQKGVTLDIDMSTAAAHPIPSFIVYGSNGAIISGNDGNESVFHVRYYNDSDLGELALYPELAAQKRSYSNFEEIPWVEESVPVSTQKELNFYDKCYDYYSLDKDPFVPIAETREVMRVIQECRDIAGWS